MADLEMVAPNYRRAQQRWPDARTLAECHDTLTACFGGSGHGMVEYIKSFIESVCLTIMRELREPMPSSSPSTTELLVAALSPLGLRNTRGASRLDKVLSGFNRLADALTEMRNDNGPIAHGKDGFLDSLTADHTRAFLHAGDAILGVLLNAFEGKQPDLTATREPYESFPHLNERIDQAVSVGARIDEDGLRPMVVFSVSTGPRSEAIELRVEPSRLLFGIDRLAYIEVLKSADLAITDKEEVDEDEEDREPLEEVIMPTTGDAPPLRPPPLTGLVQSYRGYLEPLRNELSAFLNTEAMESDGKPQGYAHLTDSLLATAEENMGLDWRQREPLQAGLKVAFKRVLVRFGSGSETAERVAERLLAWLRVHTPETEPGSH